MPELRRKGDSEFETTKHQSIKEFLIYHDLVAAYKECPLTHSI